MRATAKHLLGGSRRRLTWPGAVTTGLALVFMFCSCGTLQAVEIETSGAPTSLNVVNPQPLSDPAAMTPDLLPSPASPSEAHEGSSSSLNLTGEIPSTFSVVPRDVPVEPRLEPTAPAEPLNATPPPSVVVKGTTSETATEPMPEPIPDHDLQGPPSVEAASFNGVTPGQTTTAQLEKAWGPPKEIRNHQGTVIHQYKVAIFDQVEVTFSGEKVASIVIRLGKPFPAKMVTEQLRLDNIRPVLVSNELGDILGQAFPERGVLFAFEQNHKPGQPSMQVTEIILEPLGADPFILRAETNLDGNPALNLRDLDEAIKLSPNNTRAHWLRARVLTGMNRFEEALDASNQVIARDEDNPRFRITHAQILDRLGRSGEAIAQAKRAIDLAKRWPHVQARAECLLGDLIADSPDPDWAEAVRYHMAAVKTANPLAMDRHPAIRLAAKEVLIDAHLGAANDIAWGRWAEKEKAVAKWTERASAFAEELIANDGGNDEHRFRVATRALAAYVGVGGKLDPSDWTDKAVQVGNRLIEQTKDPLHKQQLQWELGMALFNAVQLHQIRKEHDLAMRFGQQTIEYLEAARQSAQPDRARDYLLGRLYFRLGAIRALAEKNHNAAISWFDKAVDLLKDPPPSPSPGEIGRHGETFVSMAVSYWETGQRDKALELTVTGLDLMKQAVESGTMAKSALTVPYENLAAMQRQLGKDDTARTFERLAADARNDGTVTVQRPGHSAQNQGAIRR
ncbi:MAG: hypothetical protein JW818_02020 [Pirellulales bacterium]|nr:hypothetical protein [Pirellulales bacterium]